ncbi:MAG: hypothetical protein U0736_08690 [Gemmataceae bacterium]
MNGVLSVGWRVPSFIVTLGMLEIARGALYLATSCADRLPRSPRVEAVGRPLPGLGLSPAFLAAVAVVVVAQVVLARTVFGRYVVTVGTNEEAPVRLSGVDPRPARGGGVRAGGAAGGGGRLVQHGADGVGRRTAGWGWSWPAIAGSDRQHQPARRPRQRRGVRYVLGVLIVCAVLQTGLTQTAPPSRPSASSPAW